MNVIKYSESDAISSAVEQSHLKSSINISLQKTPDTGLTTGVLFHFMSTVKGTPAYWKQFLLEVRDMVKELGFTAYLFDIFMSTFIMG